MAVSLSVVSKNIAGNKRSHDIQVSWQTTTNFTFVPATVGLHAIDEFIPESLQSGNSTLSMAYDRTNGQLRSLVDGVDASVGDTAIVLRARVIGI